MAKRSKKRRQRRFRGSATGALAIGAFVLVVLAAVALLATGRAKTFAAGALRRVAADVPWLHRGGGTSEAALSSAVPRLNPGGAALRSLAPSSGPIPFSFVDGHIFITAALDGRPGTWLVDSGSNLTVVSPRVVDQAGCPTVNVEAKADPYGIERFVSIARLSVGRAHAPLEVAGVMVKLEDQILRDDGVLVDGILGYDWLRKFRLQIDFPHRVLILLAPGPRAVPLPHRYRIPMRLVNGVPLVPVRVDDGPVGECLLDTGSNVVNLRWEFARASGLRPGDTGIRPGPRIAGLGNSASTQAAVLDTLAIGPLVFRHVPVSLYAGEGVSAMFGNIGTALFRAGRLTLDPGNGELIIEQ